MKQMIDDTLLSKLKLYSNSAPARFHMPGHKGMLDSSELGVLAPLDVTELSCTDDLNDPTDTISALENRFANLYGAKASLLLVNGSTAGNIAMLLSLGRNKRVLIARNCHKSVLSGIALAGHDVISLLPDGATGRVSSQEVDAALTASFADAVIITSPTYYGVCSDIDAISAVAHRHGAKLFVDCAHGAHFPFSAELPPCPASCDAWVVSCHKTMNSFTQTAVLHIGYSNPITAAEMRRYVSMIQSSSPSYLLMLSLENAMGSIGDWDAHCRRMIDFRAQLSRIAGVKVLSFGTGFDFTRLTISVCGYTGYSLGALLEERGIYAEMGDMESVVLITTPNDPDEWFDRLYSCLYAIANIRSHEAMPRLKGFCFAEGERKLSIREAAFCDYELVHIEESVDRIAANAVGIYPPGVAVFLPGELITRQAVLYLSECVKCGAKLFGTANDLIPVCKE